MRNTIPTEARGRHHRPTSRFRLLWGDPKHLPALPRPAISFEAGGALSVVADRHELRELRTVLPTLGASSARTPRRRSQRVFNAPRAIARSKRFAAKVIPIIREVQHRRPVLNLQIWSPDEADVPEA
jgi:hypothetical protein